MPTTMPDLPGGNRARLRRAIAARHAAEARARPPTSGLPAGAFDRTLSIADRRKALAAAAGVRHTHPGQGTHTHGGPAHHTHAP